MFSAFYDQLVINPEPKRQPGFPPRIVADRAYCPAGFHLQGDLCIADEYLPHATQIDDHNPQPPPPARSLAGRGDGWHPGTWAPPRNPRVQSLGGAPGWECGERSKTAALLGDFFGWAKEHPLLVGGIIIGTLLTAAAGGKR